MREFQERKKWRRLLFSKPVFALVFAAFAFLSYSAVKIFIKSRAIVARENETKKELFDIKQRKANMEKELNRLQSESGIEEEMRTKFDVQKPGERALVIVDKPDDNNKNSDNAGAGFFSRIWSWARGIFK